MFHKKAAKKNHLRAVKGELSKLAELKALEKEEHRKIMEARQKAVAQFDNEVFEKGKKFAVEMAAINVVDRRDNKSMRLVAIKLDLIEPFLPFLNNPETVAALNVADSVEVKDGQ